MGIWAWGIWALAELGGIQVTELLWRMGWGDVSFSD